MILRFVSAAGLVPCRVLLTYLLSELWLTFEGTHCLLLDLSHKMRQTQVVKLRNTAQKEFSLFRHLSFSLLAPSIYNIQNTI